MKLAITRFVIVAAIAVLMVAVGSTAAWAQTPCPSSPNYTPDFSANQSCLTSNDNAILPFSFDNSNVLQLTSGTSNQVGSAWYNTPQPVENGFTTSFQFQFTGASTPPADGIAFVIQNSTSDPLNAIGFTGGNGGAIGYGDADGNADPSQGQGIPNSLAIEFDTYENAWDPGPNTNGSVSHVAIQSCGTGKNTSHHNYLCSSEGSNSTVGAPVVTSTNMADGAVHSVTITYVAAVPGALATVQVTLDGANIFSSPVIVDLSTIGLGTGGIAYVGFTGATGGDYENQYILNWVFAPTVQGTPITPATLAQTVSVTLPNNTLTAGFNYNNVPAGSLTVAPGTIPYFGFSGMTQPQYAALVAGTALGGTACLTAVGLTDSNGNRECVVNTFTATTSTNPVQSGANLPQANDSPYARDILFNQAFNLNTDTQGPLLQLTNGVLTIPAGTAPGIAEFNDSASCAFAVGDPLAGQLCPRSIMTSVIDGPTKPTGTPKPAGSSQVFFCCEPLWTATPAISLWSDSTSVQVSFTANPPAPNSSTGYVPAPGLGVSFGAVAANVAPPDPVMSFPTEQTALNPTVCQGSPSSPATWTGQTAMSFMTPPSYLTQSYSGGPTPAILNLTEGAYTLLYAALDCDEFLSLKYPGQLNLTTNGTSGDLAGWNTAPFNVDLTPPQVTSITLTQLGGYVAQNSALKATVACMDPTSSGVDSGIFACGSVTASSSPSSPQLFGSTLGGPQGPQAVTTNPIALSTATLGTNTFTATAQDVAGNFSIAGSPAASVSYTVVGNADLAIGMLGGLLAKTGQTVTYDIGVANAGPATAEEVTVVDTVPSYATAVGATYATGSCTISNGTPSCSVTPKTACAISGNTITCNVGALNAWTKGNPTGVGIQVTVKVNAIVKAGTVMTNSVSVSGVANADPNLKNNTAPWPTLITN
jgi:uncharacterized repeat protein (TIGR01451 family)